MTNKIPASPYESMRVDIQYINEVVTTKSIKFYHTDIDAISEWLATDHITYQPIFELSSPDGDVLYRQFYLEDVDKILDGLYESRRPASFCGNEEPIDKQINAFEKLKDAKFLKKYESLEVISSWT